MPIDGHKFHFLTTRGNLVIDHTYFQFGNLPKHVLSIICRTVFHIGAERVGVLVNFVQEEQEDCQDIPMIEAICAFRLSQLFNNPTSEGEWVSQSQPLFFPNCSKTPQSD